MKGVEILVEVTIVILIVSIWDDFMSGNQRVVVIQNGTMTASMNTPVSGSTESRRRNLQLKVSDSQCEGLVEERQDVLNMFGIL